MSSTYKQTLIRAFLALLCVVFLGSGDVFAGNKNEGKSKRSEKGYSQIWSENCARCHFMRSPSDYSDTRWDVSVLHMRIRAGLSAKDAKAILKFLKASN